jgi:hypothetical protein
MMAEHDPGEREGNDRHDDDRLDIAAQLEAEHEVDADQPE